MKFALTIFAVLMFVAGVCYWGLLPLMHLNVQ
jgi:hypothetical protein